MERDAAILIALLTHSGDIAAARRLLNWIALLDGTLPTHDALIVCDAAVPYREAMKLRDDARKIFRQVHFTTNGTSVTGWQAGSYSLFKTAVRKVAEKWPQPFLLLEPDCVPLRKGWLDAIAADYNSFQCPFMGHIYRAQETTMPRELMSGIAVYPADAAARLPLREQPVHWDVDCAEVMVSEGANTPLIHHFFGQQDSPSVFAMKRDAQAGNNVLTLADLPRDAVMFHRNKDGSLIRLLSISLGLVKNPGKEKTYIQLGRLGDIIILLPAMKHIYDTEGIKPRLIVSTEFASVLDGVSYVEKEAIGLNWGQIHAATVYAKNKGWAPVVTQGHGVNWTAKDPFNCPNYMTAMHARTGVPIDLMTKLPLVFDQRDKRREAAAACPADPFIAVNWKGWTSPFKDSAIVMADLKKHFGKRVNFADMGAMKLPKVYDLIGVMDRAIGTITIDTVTLHLAAASPKPYIALVNNGGSASTPRGNCVLTIPYADVLRDVRKIIDTVEGWIKPLQVLESIGIGRYVVGTGYYNKTKDGLNDPAKRSFFDVWYENTMKFSKPHEIIVLAVNGARIKGAPGEWLTLTGNLGHTHDLTNYLKPYEMCGWSAAFVTLAMVAYANECDLIFKEQDALAFGPWVERIYQESKGRGMMFGGSKGFACAQSIALVKHDFIPEFVRLYLLEGSEQDKANECELKFSRMAEKYPQKIGRFSFGCDRDRPIPYDADVFYAQQFSEAELAELRQRKLIE